MDLSIIIVNYNSGSDLGRCLASIAESSIPGSHEVIVVDNASNDGSESIMASAHPAVLLVRNPTNMGFGAGVNAGVTRAIGRYLLILNPDILIGREALVSLMRYLDEHADVGLCAPKLLYPDRSLQLSCRTFYTLPVVALRRTWLGRCFPNHQVVREHLLMDWDHATTREVDWVIGAAMLLRREAFSGAKIMDERFFLYFEDVDLCLRLRRAGWRVIYHPASIMIHAHRRASAGGFFTRAKFEHLRSWLKFEWKHRVAPRLGKRPDQNVVTRIREEAHA